MLDQNSEYILWLTKRLVYKYKEDPQIIRVVEKILLDNNKELCFYKKAHQKINSFLVSSMSHLSEIKKEYSIGLATTAKETNQKSIEINNKTFENLDITNLFG